MDRQLRKKAIHLIWFVPCLCLLGVLAMCVLWGTGVRTEASEHQLPLLESVPRSHWEALAQKHIFFGHQSVGYNILDGVKDVMKEHGFIRLNVVEASDHIVLGQPALTHCKVGKNHDPLSKIKAFANVIDRDEAADVDIALVKFCYVDIKHDSNVESVFGAYVETMEQLKRRHPSVEYIHVTVPLRSAENGVRWCVEQRVKRLIGQPTILEDNHQRHRYNQLLREMYSPGGTVYDLALVESTTPQGQSHYVKKSREKVPFLCMDYSADGGHLNALGRRRAAEQLLITLAEVAYRQGH